ncbi:unnamed protein product [Allacma fusca]|uniref:Uncharacterized protein n=1 Tax=Allacma fusca TaxID=39272 RepID=A0A8J2PQR2_9HEXA|nr:unnamed protein product [Allacma fusca]
MMLPCYDLDFVLSKYKYGSKCDHVRIGAAYLGVFNWGTFWTEVKALILWIFQKGFIGRRTVKERSVEITKFWNQGWNWVLFWAHSGLAILKRRIWIC